MTEIPGGELLARCLAAESVRFVFGLPCPEVDPLLAAAETESAEAVIGALQARYEHIADLRADFVQEAHVASVDQHAKVGVEIATFRISLCEEVLGQPLAAA